MDDDTVQTVALTEEQIDKIIEDGYLIANEIPFCTYYGWDVLNKRKYEYDKKPCTSVDSWSNLRDEKKDEIVWYRYDLVVVKEDDDGDEVDWTTVDRERLGNCLLLAFESADGEMKQQLNDCIYSLGFRLEKTYKIVDTMDQGDE